MATSIISEAKDLISYDINAPVWIGLDVHKRSYAVALKIGDYSPLTWTAPANPEKLVNTLSSAGLHPNGVCYEAGPTGFSLARVLQNSDIPVIIAAPSKVPRSVSPGSKTDRLDCIKLALFASKGLIHPIAIPSVTAESERALLRRRHQLTDGIRKCKQRIKAQFLFHGFPEPPELKYWSKESPKVLIKAGLPAGAQSRLKSHVRELVFLMDERKIIDRELHQISTNSEHCKTIEALRSVPGVGLIVAMTFHLELFDPNRFSRKEEVASFLGLAPLVHHSGERNPRGHIVPIGQQRLRSLLVEASWTWVSKDDGAGKLYRKLLGRTGIPQKAITAVARKLAIILWRLSIEQRTYYPQAI